MRAELLLALLPAVAAPPMPSSLHLVLMIDVSDSVIHPGPLRLDRDVGPDAADALASVLGSADVGRGGRFGGTIDVGSELRTRQEVSRAGGGLVSQVGGASPLWDAVAAAADALNG